ncbi:Allergen V5/Tpx-1 related protein [Sulfitobacter guttiformis KCTC 32187]|nr:Allergen V5/Tpx-1 related protein [Sulfitobacter guttiformis KCTC 32187]
MQSATSVIGGPAADRLNNIRARAGLGAVSRNPILDAAALRHADDMVSANFFSHTGSNGSTVGKRVKAAGYRWCTVAENINKGYSGRSAAIEAWRTSPSHFRNMTNPKVRHFGLANVGDVWVMVLAAKRC